MVLARAGMGLLITVYSFTFSRYFFFLLVAQVFSVNFFCHFGSGFFVCIWSKSVVYYFTCIISITVNSLSSKEATIFS